MSNTVEVIPAKCRCLESLSGERLQLSELCCLQVYTMYTCLRMQGVPINITESAFLIDSGSIRKQLAAEKLSWVLQVSLLQEKIANTQVIILH